MSKFSWTGRTIFTSNASWFVLAGCTVSQVILQKGEEGRSECLVKKCLRTKKSGSIFTVLLFGWVVACLATRERVCILVKLRLCASKVYPGANAEILRLVSEVAVIWARFSVTRSLKKTFFVSTRLFSLLHIQIHLGRWVSFFLLLILNLVRNEMKMKITKITTSAWGMKMQYRCKIYLWHVCN